jgi:two-component system, NarL family, sensor histidine kinase LiaS
MAQEIKTGTTRIRRLRPGGLFWRMALSYLAVSVVAVVISVAAGRFEGPFGFLRHSDFVRFFNHLFDNQTNGTLLIITVIALIGVVTGAMISANLHVRVAHIARAAEAWSQGDFSVVVRDKAGDELGQLARDLNRMAEQIQTLLTSRQALAVVEERNRLARDLHDTVKQHVFANALLVRAARKQLARDPHAAEAHLAEAEDLADQTQQELIELIRALRPAALADKGLVAVLRSYVDDWSRQMSIAVDMRVLGERATPLEIEDALLRVAQEALANVVRHSGAQAVQVRLAWDGSQVSLAVQDDGSGFDLAQAEGQGVGLASMRERVEALGGTLCLSSSPSGTSLETTVPFAPLGSVPRPDSAGGAP